MKRSLLRYLVCPQTGEPLELQVREEQNDQIKEGQLVSSGSGHTYPIHNYVPRFVTAEEYTSTFSMQRQYVKRHFRHYQRDRSGFSLFYETTGFSKGQIAKGLSLEIGCGYGRFVDVVQQDGGEVIGVDLSSDSIDLAQKFVGLRPNVHLIHCDLFRLPFAERSFSAVYSIGVLHHTPDCKAAFQTLPRYLAPDGQISIWVYHPDNQTNTRRWRRLTTKWSFSALYAWCIINQVMFSGIRRIPVIRWKFNRLIPGSVPKPGQHFWLRVLEDFDNLSPAHASNHTPDEVVRWFREAGLANIRTLNRLTAVTGYSS